MIIKYINTSHRVLATLLVGVLLTNLALGDAWHIRSVFADAGHAHGDEIAGGESEYPVVTVVKAENGSNSEIYIDAAGTILTNQDSEVYPLRDGILQSLYVNVGDSVQKGQVIGTLYSDVEQAGILADLAVAQAEFNANEQRSTFLTDLEGPQREQLEAALEFASENLNYSEGINDSLLSQFETAQSVVESELISFEATFQAELNVLDVEISNAELVLSQQQVSALNGISDVLFAIEGLMYNRAGVLTGNMSVINASDRRDSVYFLNQTAFRELQWDLFTYYEAFSEYQDLSLQEQVEDPEVVSIWLNDILEIAKDARQLANESSAVGSHTGDISTQRDDLDAAIDHLIKLSEGIIDAGNSIVSAQAEKITLELEFEQEKIELQGELDNLEQEVNVSISEQSGDVVTNESEISDLQSQLALFELEFEQQVLESELSLGITAAQVNSIQQMIYVGNSIIAPFSGIISKRYVNDGASVGLDQPVVHLVNESEKYIQFFVTEEDFPFVEVGQNITFNSSVSKLIKGNAVISGIAPSLDKDSRTVLIVAEILSGQMNDKFLANMSIRVQIPVSSDPDLFVVPEAALELSKNGDEIWFVNEELQAETLSVELNFIYDGYAYLETDLTGYWVIIRTPEDLVSGLEIETTL
jgi:RND family efflux transporter MFP subunit